MFGELFNPDGSLSRRVLVVDVEPYLRDMIARHYRKRGDRVVVAASAEEVQQRGHLRRDWDVVIADIHLPALSGIEIARRISHRADSLVLITGDADRLLADEALRDLHAGYLLKPFELFQLDAAVRLATRRKRLVLRVGDWFAAVRKRLPIRKAAATDSVRLPARALVLSIGALLAPLIAVFSNVVATPYEPLLFISALIPPFLMAYYKGWRGATSALALGMVSLALLAIATNLIGTAIPAGATLPSMLITFVATCLGAGWMSHGLHEHRADAQRNALSDPLTGLANKAHLESFLNGRFAAGRRNGGSCTIVFFDLDHFKHWNSDLGHEAGDKAIVAFADALRRNTRAMDLCGRWGGEHFVTILNSSDLASANAYTERVRQSLRRVGLFGRRLTASIGVAFQQAHMTEPDELIAAAEIAVQEAKAAGRDCVRISQPKPEGAPTCMVSLQVE